MKNILKQSISCCLLFCCLLSCTACGTETESPDTLEDILNPNRKKQETEMETTTEYQGIFFQPETEVQTEVSETSVIQTEVSETVTIPTETTEITIQTEDAPETAPLQIEETDWLETNPIMTTIPQPVTEVMTETETVISGGWESAYREFLESKAFQRQISADVQEADTKFLLLYLDEDDIPELFIQTTMEVLIYAYHQNQVVYVDSFYPSHYTYVFYYRPYHNCLGTLQGSVMSDGTYLEIYEFAHSDLAASGLSLKETYCYPTREYSYEIYAERGMNIDLDKAPELDVYPNRENNIGSSWITVPDVLENSTSVQRYEITEEGLNEVFGSKETDIEETIQEGKYAFG